MMVAGEDRDTLPYQRRREDVRIPMTSRHFSFDSPFPPPFRRKRESRPMSRERRNENGNSVPCVPGKCSHEQVLAQGSQSTGGVGPRAVENGVDLGA